jgi:threonine/homoserine/homoserine lactone efflux protein
LDPVLAVIAILGALSIGVISPGPSFVLVARTSIAMSRRDGLAAAIGMGLGGVVFCLLALAGLTAVLATVEWLFAGLRLLGGAYLIYLGIMIWRGADAPIVVSDKVDAGVGRGRSFIVGFMTQISNPKTAVVYASVFAALLPPSLPGWIYVVLPLLIFSIETVWYVAVALLFSAAQPRAAYLRAKRWIDRLAGIVMGLLGVRLVVEAART